MNLNGSSFCCCFWLKNKVDFGKGRDDNKLVGWVGAYVGMVKVPEEEEEEEQVRRMWEELTGKEI